MQRLLPILFLCFSLTIHAAESLTWKEAFGRADLRAQLTVSAPDQLALVVANSGSAVARVTVPAGTTASGADGTARLVVLQDTLLEIAPASSAEALMPAALLSAKLPPPEKAVRFGESTEPRLAPLLKRFAKEKDLPRATAQLAVLATLEDLHFAGWQKFLAAQRAPGAEQTPRPTPAEVVQAFDAVGLLREVAPTQKFALAEDGELKLRALRNPWCRAKAMQLYGIAGTDDGSEFGLPNIGQLLHTKPGDNCPVCRNREEMKKGAWDF